MATNQEVGSSILSGRTIFSHCRNASKLARFFFAHNLLNGVPEAGGA
jgi:hypothetical protein